MSSQFWPCTASSRHVRRGNALCPFCGVGVSVDIPPTRVFAARLSRAALFAAGAVAGPSATRQAVADRGPCALPAKPIEYLELEPIPVRLHGAQHLFGIQDRPRRLLLATPQL